MTKQLFIFISFLALLGCTPSYESVFDYPVEPPSNEFLREYFDHAAATSRIPYKVRDGRYYTTDQKNREALDSLSDRVKSAGTHTIELDIPKGCVISWFVSYLLDEDVVFLPGGSDERTARLILAIPEFEGTELQIKYFEFVERCQDGT